MSTISKLKKNIINFNCFIQTVIIAVLVISCNTVSQAKGEKQILYTPSIVIDASVTNTKSVVSYTVDQQLTSTNRGIFIALPYVSDGVKIDYRIYDVTKENEKEQFQAINDIYNFRVRIGDPNKTVIAGQYRYRFVIESSYSEKNKFTLPLLKEWNDEVGNLQVTVDGERKIDSFESNKNKTFEYEINSSKTSLTWPEQFINTHFSVLWGLIIAFITSIIGFFSIRINPLSSKTNYTSSELSAPKNMVPWQGVYIANNGAIDFKNTIIAYFLYLNNKKYIKINPQSENKKINITILQELPNILPEVYNTIVTESQNKDFNQIFKDNNISAAEGSKTIEAVELEVKKLYSVLPNRFAVGSIFVGYGIIYTIITIIYFVFIRERFLIGNPWLILVLGAGLCFIPSIYKWQTSQERFTPDGFLVFLKVKGFYNYINTSEKDKLNFDNNPQMGVKYYLENVAWAAQFGLLDKFNQYAKLLNIPSELVDQTNVINVGLISSSFYVDPTPSGSDSGGGGFSGGGGSW